MFDHTLLNHKRIFHSFGDQSGDFWPKIGDFDLFWAKKIAQTTIKSIGQTTDTKIFGTYRYPKYRYRLIPILTDTWNIGIGRYRYYRYHQISAEPILWYRYRSFTSPESSTVFCRTLAQMTSSYKK